MLADVTGSVVLVWRFRTERSDSASRSSGSRTWPRSPSPARLGVIAVALLFESISALIAGSHPGSQRAYGDHRRRVDRRADAARLPQAPRRAARLGSHALKGDSTLSAIGASTALLALLGLVLYDPFGWWWADRAVALAIAGVAVLEARTLLTAEHADD